MEQKSQSGKLKKWHKWVIGFLILGIIGSIFKPKEDKNNTVEPVLSQAQLDSISLEAITKKGKFEAEVNLRTYIKDRLNDPKSFEVLNQKTWAIDSTIVVMIEYTAKNAFGGVVRNTIQAEADVNGNLTKVFEK